MARVVFNFLLRDQVSKGIDNIGKKVSGLDKTTGRIGGALRGLAGAAVAAAGVTGGIQFFGNAISEAREAAKVTRLTEQVIRSTGGAAKVTAADVGKLSEALSNKAGIDDEVIQNGANILLTFKGIRNEVGKGNDIFNQATAIATDMSVALGQDMKSSSIQLGKALNDPIRGITALQRVGVTFTEQQKEQIKTLVESGDVMGAQKIILKELGSEFGGAAAAAADPMDKLKVIAGNLMERLGTELLPVVNKAAEWLGDHLPGALDKAESFFRQVIPPIKEFASWIGRNKDLVLTLAGAVGGAVAAFRAFMFIKNVITAVRAFNLVLAANPIGLVITLIAALAAGLIYAYNHSETFRKIVQAAWQGIQDAISFAWNKIIKPVFEFLVKAVQNTITWFGNLGTNIGRVWEGIKAAFQAGVRWVVDKFLGMVEWLITAAARAFGWVPGIGPKLKEAAKKFGTFRDDVNRALGGIKDRTVDTQVYFSSNAARLAYDLRHQGLADGGPVQNLSGMGRRSYDTEPAMLRVGEHVWTPEEVDAVGGHGPMYRMRALARAGQLRGFAWGGAVGMRTAAPRVGAFGNVDSATWNFADRYAGALVKALQKVVDKLLTGRWVRPVATFVITSGFGRRGSGFHTGIDLAGPVGTPIVAASAGRVSRVRSLTTSYGKHVFIEHAGGIQTRYAHMSSLGAHVGQSVAPGTRIGRRGSTGNSTGPHLHFEVRRGGAAINPAPFMRARGVRGFGHGGFLPVGGTGLVGELGMPELVTATSGGTIIRPLGGRGGGDVYNIRVSGVVGDPQAVVDKIHEGLLRKKRQHGGVRLGLS